MIMSAGERRNWNESCRVIENIIGPDVIELPRLDEMSTKLYEEKYDSSVARSTYLEKTKSEPAEFNLKLDPGAYIIDTRERNSTGDSIERKNSYDYLRKEINYTYMTETSASASDFEPRDKRSTDSIVLVMAEDTSSGEPAKDNSQVQCQLNCRSEHNNVGMKTKREENEFSAFSRESGLRSNFKGERSCFRRYSYADAEIRRRYSYAEPEIRRRYSYAEPEIRRQYSYAEPETRHSRKKLLILDINGLLADIVSDFPPGYRPDRYVSRKAVFKRPFCDDFLQFCFETFDVGVWSSRTKRNVDMVIDFLLGRSRRNLLFCWDQSQCTDTGYHTIDNKDKPLVLKELKKIWNKIDPYLPWKEGEYNETNTLLLDDSPYKALRNPPNTAIFPPTYRFEDVNDASLGPGGDLRVYLEGLASADNVQKYVEQNPFGQLAITESDASWNFYSKVLGIEQQQVELEVNVDDNGKSL